MFIPSIVVHNQSWAQIKASKVLGLSLFRYGDKCLPPVLKADSEATVEIGTTKISLATCCKTGYLIPLVLHQARISKLAALGKTGSSK